MNSTMRAFSVLLLLAVLMVFSESFQNPGIRRSSEDTVKIFYFWNQK